MPFVIYSIKQTNYILYLFLKFFLDVLDNAQFVCDIYIAL